MRSLQEGRDVPSYRKGSATQIPRSCGGGKEKSAVAPTPPTAARLGSNSVICWWAPRRRAEILTHRGPCLALGPRATSSSWPTKADL